MTELLFLHSARRLMLFDICIKFREYSLSGFQVIERTGFCDGQSSKENNSKSIKGTVTILAHHLMLIDICISFVNIA